jgi:leucine dehydrogenase
MYCQYPDFDGHALIASRDNPKKRFSAFIAIHSEVRGPAMGGCRIVPYASAGEAITDVLRLSRGMTYKNAIANIPYGGGKAVIIADPKAAAKQDLLYEMGDFVRSLEGRYITSFDSGTTIEDVRTIGERTDFVAGTLLQAGNASDSTALGVYHCLRAVADLKFRAKTLSGITVAIQGVGSVGRRLAQRLAEDGARLIVADVDEQAARSVAIETGADVASVHEILYCNADIVSPNALGAVLNVSSIAMIKARAVVGGANNQLATPKDDERLRAAGILYCPDYVANGGGIIDLHHQRSGWNAQAVERHVMTLAETFRKIAERAEARSCGTSSIADEIARERLTPA